MNPDAVDRCMEKAVQDGVFPGAVLRVWFKGRTVYEKAVGVTDRESLTPVDPSTVYDLASLTKPLATASAFMILVQKGRVSLESRLCELIAEFRDNDKKDVTVGQLLCHTSGLADHRPYYETLQQLPGAGRPGALKSLLQSEPLINPPGAKVVYSDLGYMILNWIIEARSGMTIDRFFEHEILLPLTLSDLYYIRKNERDVTGRIIAPTETCPWRKKTLKGEVHDDNAWVMGGCCAHAGLFGTARGVSDFLVELLGVYHGTKQSAVFSPDVVRTFLTEWNGFRRTPGFDMPSAEGSSSGHLFSPGSVGHLGFTGTSFWMDLEREIIVVLLSNRVHPSRDHTAIRAFRPLIHDTVMEELLQRG